MSVEIRKRCFRITCFTWTCVCMRAFHVICLTMRALYNRFHFPLCLRPPTGGNITPTPKWSGGQCKQAEFARAHLRFLSGRCTLRYVTICCCCWCADCALPWWTWLAGWFVPTYRHFYSDRPSPRVSAFRSPIVFGVQFFFTFRRFANALGLHRCLSVCVWLYVVSWIDSVNLVQCGCRIFYDVC